MRKIQILGMGCAKCGELAKRAEQAAREMELEFEIEKIQDLAKILSFGVMVTPALVVDGVVKASGNVPPLARIKEMLK